MKDIEHRNQSNLSRWYYVSTRPLERQNLVEVFNFEITRTRNQYFISQSQRDEVTLHTLCGRRWIGADRIGRWAKAGIVTTGIFCFEDLSVWILGSSRSPLLGGSLRARRR
jgi:hypothetical protein